MPLPENIERANAVVRAAESYSETFPRAMQRVKRPKPEQRIYFAKMVGALATWKASRGRLGVVLDGAVGGGKSSLCSLLSRFAATKGIVPVYISCIDLRTDLRGLPSERERGEPHYLDLLRSADLLVLDDIGREKGVVDAESFVSTAIELCNRAETFLALPSNLDWKDLTEYLGDERDVSRLMRLERIHIGDEVPDYRPAEGR